MSSFTPRPKQQEVLTYRGGRMGVAAVPGSGKTWTLSRLAADIISENLLADDQEVLVVTLVNSAVDNFYQRVSDFIKQESLLPFLGYRVRTLHGLAHDIVRERPDLLGLDANFQIVDEREAANILEDAVNAWLSSHPFTLDEFIDPQLDENRMDWVRRQQLPNLVKDAAMALIRYAKDRQLTPERLSERLGNVPVPLHLAEMGLEIYTDYQRGLAYRGGVDFDDLIRLALEALEQDETLLDALRWRWPYILEDEAQDSSELQEKILAKLAGKNGNWVRVGDPNQAIYETFTTANPEFLLRFIAAPGVARRELPNSGRSTASIIELANHLVDWSQEEHPTPLVRNALQAPPYIEPTPAGDPQPNPPDDPSQIHLVLRKYTPQEEIEAVADSVARWLPENPESTLGILVPRNHRANEVVDALRRRKVEPIDSLLRSTSSTRVSAGALANLLQYLADPGSATKLSKVYRVWRREDREDVEANKIVERGAEILRKCDRVEDFIYPHNGTDWLESTALEFNHPELHEQLLEFREHVRRWQAAILLPVDQILLTLGPDLFSEAHELALTHKLALLLRRAADTNPSWRLPELTGELAVIARNERRFLGFSEDDSGFDPDRYKGKAVVSTMHKAKGLEWDRVYLMSVNTYNFPSGNQADTYIAEKWFLRDRLNLQAETLAQLDAALETNQYRWYEEGQATADSRLEYVRERLRLLYVGITRARRELVITYNSARRGDAFPAVALAELASYWEVQHPQPE